MLRESRSIFVLSSSSEENEHSLLRASVQSLRPTATGTENLTSAPFG